MAFTSLPVIRKQQKGQLTANWERTHGDLTAPDPVMAECQVGLLKNAPHWLKPKFQPCQGVAEEDWEVKWDTGNEYINTLQLWTLEKQMWQPILGRTNWVRWEGTKEHHLSCWGGFHKQPNAGSKELTRLSRFHPANTLYLTGRDNSRQMIGLQRARYLDLLEPRAFWFVSRLSMGFKEHMKKTKS